MYSDNEKSARDKLFRYSFEDPLLQHIIKVGEDQVAAEYKMKALLG